MYVACARIAAVNRPIASGSDIFLPLPLLAGSSHSQSRRVAILICSIHRAFDVSSSVLTTFASGAYTLPCGEIKIQVASMECSPWQKGRFRRCIYLVYHHGSLCHGRSPTVGGVPTWHHVGTYLMYVSTTIVVISLNVMSLFLFGLGMHSPISPTSYPNQPLHHAQRGHFHLAHRHS